MLTTILQIITSLFISTNINEIDCSIKINNKEICIEVADTEQKRSKGLMNQTNIASNYAMLFVFEDLQIIRMWMKNTPVSLNMIFLDEKACVVSKTDNTIPFSQEIISSHYLAKYVLEIPHYSDHISTFQIGKCYSQLLIDHET